ncbi:MAG: DUF5667 domain-containing protein [bacterium]|nr:DUF5667 domain-containing protein [bacterium]
MSLKNHRFARTLIFANAQMKKFVFCLLFVLFSFGLVSLALAQSEVAPSPVAPVESPTPSVGSTITEDLPTVTAQDLGVNAPRVLPDSRFYFFKDWQRNLGLALTFNPVKKAELRQKILNEKLVELDKLAEKTQNPELIQKATDAAQKEMEKLKEQVEKFKNTAQNNPEIEKFLGKFVEHSILQQKLLEKLETKVPPQALERIETARQRQLQRFGDVMAKLEAKEKIAERVNAALEKQAGNEFKPLKDLQFLRSLEEKLPTQAQEAMKRVQEKKMLQVQEKLDKMSAEDQLKMVNYLQKMGGDKQKQLEILETVRTEIKNRIQAGQINAPELEKKLEEVKSKVINKIENLPQKSSCPGWVAPLPGFCQEGRVVIGKDLQTGCLLPAKCVVAEENKKGGVCAALWNPVCGDDGKTYSNDCFARLKGVSVVYKGECQVKTEYPPVPAPVTP